MNFMACKLDLKKVAKKKVPGSGGRKKKKGIAMKESKNSSPCVSMDLNLVHFYLYKVSQYTY